MSIREEARQEAERRWPALNPGDVELTYPRGALRATARKAFEAGAVWAREQDTREPSDKQAPAAGCAYCVGAGGYEDYDGEWRECSCQRAARTPSDDEREELANLIPLGFREQDGVRNVYDAADRILTAGFRKADREPSERQD